jgi:hypothetical protein
MLSRGYRFESFGQAKFQAVDSRVCLLRHDVDADVDAALRMAELESEMGIKATYFLMLRSPAYNLMARHSSRAVESILHLGHWIGLHYDRGFVPVGELGHEKWMEYEAKALETLFGERVDAISFHQPGRDVLDGKVNTGSRINTYDRDTLRYFQYFSDSNRTLKLGVEDLNGQNLQLLLHPMWWVYNDLGTFDVWDRVIENNFELSQTQFLSTEGAYGPRRKITVTRHEA